MAAAADPDEDLRPLGREPGQQQQVREQRGRQRQRDGAQQSAHRRRRVASQGEQDDAEPDQGRDDPDRGGGTDDLDSLHAAPSLSLPDTIPLSQRRERGDGSGGTASIGPALRRHSIPWSEERSMNWDRIEGNWKQFKGKVQQQWGSLTDDDLDRIEGKRKELAGRIQERYGKSQEEADREVDEWLARN